MTRLSLMSLTLLSVLAGPAFAVEPMTSTDLESQAIAPPAGATAAPSQSSTRNKADTDAEKARKADESFAKVMAEASKILGKRAGLEYDLSVSGVHYGDSGENRVYQDGSFAMDVPERIDQVSLENIRVRQSDTPPMGNVFMQNIEVNNSEVIVTPR